jgi:SAM-dependent methyltransferase
MLSSDDEFFVRAATKRLYGDGQRIWDPEDRWNAYKRSVISEFSDRHASRLIAEAKIILDAGCGSESYPWLPERAICLDRYFGQARTRSNAIVGDLGSLPFNDSSIDFLVCIASVLNYVSAVEAISEISRVLRPGGYLLLHFETSTSFEHILHSRWGSPVVRTDTMNSGRPDTLWIYRPSYIATILAATKLSINKIQEFHIASALALRLGLSQQLSARFAMLDPLLQLFSMFADDVIILAERRA